MFEQRPRLLVLNGRYIAGDQLPCSLSEHFDLDVVTDVDLAISKLREGEYHGVLADVGDFMPLERNLVSQQSSLVLDTIGEGVCIVSAEAKFTWCNRRMRSFDQRVLDRVLGICKQAMVLFDQQSGPSSDLARVRSKKFSFNLNDDRYYEMVVSPIRDDDSQAQRVVAVVWDETSGKRLQQKIDAIDAAGSELARLDADAIAKLSPSKRLELLRDKIIGFSKDLMHFDHFAVRVLDQENNKLEIVISEGMPEKATEVNLQSSPEGNGISGYVASVGRSYICHDTERDPLYVFGLEHSKSSLTVPLMLHDRVIGVFNIESRSANAFNEDDRQFAEIFGRYIAMALNMLDLLVRERCTTSLAITDSVVQEVAEPLNDINADAQALLEEHVGDDDLRERITRILSNVETIRNSVFEVAAGPKTILGAAEAVQKQVDDPILADRHVLIADDEPNIRNTIANILKKHGCRVTVCEDGLEASNAIEASSFDLVISDIRMPHRNGYEVFSAARHRDENLPVVLMTGFGYDPNHSIVRASEEGLAAVLFKPFKADALIEQVRDALKKNNHVKPEQQPHG